MRQGGRERRWACVEGWMAARKLRAIHPFLVLVPLTSQAWPEKCQWKWASIPLKLLTCLLLRQPQPSSKRLLRPPPIEREASESRAVGASHLSLSRCHPRGRNGRKRRTLDVTSEPQGFKH